jgi:uncharacterized Zn-finger protein
VDFKINIPTDSEGFYSLQCPHCKERFKASAGDIQAEDILELFCPSCGLIGGSSDFIPSEVIEHAKTLALNYMQQEIFKSFKKTSWKVKDSGLTIDVKRPREEQPELLKEAEDLELIELLCCDKTIKVNIDQKVSNVYCPFCGVN